MSTLRKFNLINVGISLICIWLAIVFYAYLTGISGLLTIHDYVFYPWAQIRWATLYIWTPWVVLVPAVFFLAKSIPVLPDNWSVAILKHVVLMVVLAFFHGFSASLLYYHIGYMSADMKTYEAWQHTGHFLFGDDVFLIDAFIYTFLVASQNIKSFFLLTQKNELDSVRMQSQLFESRLQALKMQINPHFLFNTLNSVLVLIKKKDIDKAGGMINRLSDFFRLTLEQGQEQFLALGKELSLIRQYLEIEKIRFGDRLTVEYQITEDFMDEPVPTMLLQPLVENAIKHGLGKKPGSCHLLIQVRRISTGIELLVSDNGIGTAQAMNTFKGVGLKNVMSRLNVIYAEQHHFAFSSSPDSGTTVTIAMPISSFESETSAA